jgi:hypothetical protein
MRIPHALALAVATVASSSAAAAQHAAVAATLGHAGFASDRLARIDTFMRRAVDSNRIAGAVVW